MVGAVVSRFDWLQGVCYFDSSDLAIEFLGYLTALVRDNYYSGFRPLHRGEDFDQVFISVRQYWIAGVRREVNRTFKLYLELSGSFCSQFSERDQRFLIDSLLGYGFFFTRVDICLDDYGRRVSHEQILEVGRSGQFGSFQIFKYIESSVSGGPKGPCSQFGVGDKLLRFYDANVVHQLEADRWELQLRDEYAKNAVQYFLDGEFTAAILLGSCNFRDVPWWESLKVASQVESVHVPGSVRLISLEKSINWLFEQVSCTLAVLYYVYGQERFNKFISDLVRDGSSRFSPYHYALIETYKGCF